MSMGTDWNPGGFQEPDYQQPQQSGLGLASFLLSLLSGLSIFGIMAYAVALTVQNDGEQLPEDSPQTIMIGTLFLFALILNMLAFVLGIVALFQPNRKRVFAILGLVFSILLFLGGGGVLVLGLMSE